LVLKIACHKNSISGTAEFRHRKPSNCSATNSSVIRYPDVVNSSGAQCGAQAISNSDCVGLYRLAVSLD